MSFSAETDAPADDPPMMLVLEPRRAHMRSSGGCAQRTSHAPRERAHPLRRAATTHPGTGHDVWSFSGRPRAVGTLAAPLVGFVEEAKKKPDKQDKVKMSKLKKEFRDSLNKKNGGVFDLSNREEYGKAATLVSALNGLLKTLYLRVYDDEEKMANLRLKIIELTDDMNAKIKQLATVRFQGAAERVILKEEITALQGEIEKEEIALRIVGENVVSMTSLIKDTGEAVAEAADTSPAAGEPAQDPPSGEDGDEEDDVQDAGLIDPETGGLPRQSAVGAVNIAVKTIQKEVNIRGMTNQKDKYEEIFRALQTHLGTSFDSRQVAPERDDGIKKKDWFRQNNGQLRAVTTFNDDIAANTIIYLKGQGFTVEGDLN